MPRCACTTTPKVAIRSTKISTGISGWTFVRRIWSRESFEGQPKTFLRPAADHWTPALRRSAAVLKMASSEKVTRKSCSTCSIYSAVIDSPGTLRSSSRKAVQSARVWMRFVALKSISTVRCRVMCVGDGASAAAARLAPPEAAEAKLGIEWDWPSAGNASCASVDWQERAPLLPVSAGAEALMNVVFASMILVAKLYLYE